MKKMEHPPTSSALEDSAHKFRLALAALADGSIPSIDPRIADALGCAAAVITQAREMIDARDITIARLRADNMATGQTARFQDAALESLHERLDMANAALAENETTIIALSSQITSARIDAAAALSAPFAATIKDRDATIANLQSINDKRDKTIANLHEAIGAARKDRASIVAFLAAEASRFDEAIKSVGAASGARQLLGEMLVMRDRLIAQAGLLRTLVAQIKRGDDRQGFDAPADSDRAPVRDLLSAAVAFRDAEAAWDAATPEDGEWATVEVVESAADKQRTALESLCAAATRAASLMVDRARFGAAADREVER